ncbi:MAG: hypothetical protein IPK74_28845 [Deltaproteobacteria bacterium]|nr:hypothetical protein [Deltaproteobacteria bacterium]
MWRWWWLSLVFACGPAVDVSTNEATSSAASGSSSSSSAAPTDTTAASDPGTTSTTSGAPTDADLCVSWCLNAEARGCADVFVGETCYGRCLDAIVLAEQGACIDVYREVIACEAVAAGPAEPSCEARECEAVYIQHDLCQGSCWHLGGIPGGGGTQSACEWRGTGCYGHDLEVVCPVEDATALCDCIVDDTVISQCEVGEALAAFDCGGEDMQIFTTCCRGAFEGVLLP